MLKTILITAATATSLATGQSLFNKGLSSRCDVIMIGDSNQLFGGYGFDSGYAAALAKRYGLYSTGLHFAGENDGLGAGVGYKCNTLAQGINSPYIFGQDSVNQLLQSPEAFSFNPNASIFLADGETCVIPIGIRLESDSPLDVGKTHIFHYKYATFNYGEGVFRPWCRFGNPAYQGQMWSVPITSSTGEKGSNIGSMITPSWDSTRPLEFVVNYNDHNNTTIGPVAFSWMRVETPAHNTGFAVHTMYGKGGASSYDMAKDITSQSIVVLADYLYSATLLQNESGLTIVRINSGMNDRTETQPSVTNQYVGNSPEAYVDNIKTIISRIKEAWLLLNKSPDQLYFLVSVSHPISEPNDFKLKEYEAALQKLTNSHVLISKQSNLISANELLSRDWYNSSVDHFHLKPDAYNEIASREIEAAIIY